MEQMEPQAPEPLEQEVPRAVRMWRANVSYQIYNVLLLVILLATVARPKTWIAMYESAEGKTSGSHAHKPPHLSHLSPHLRRHAEPLSEAHRGHSEAAAEAQPAAQPRHEAAAGREQHEGRQPPGWVEHELHHERGRRDRERGRRDSPRGTARPATTTTEPEGPCLCGFGIGGTLVGRRGHECEGIAGLGASAEPSLAGGQLTLSALGRSIADTFCSRCHLAVISAGPVGDDVKAAVHRELSGVGDLPNVWSEPAGIMSPLVTGCDDVMKAMCLHGVVHWYSNRGVDIPPRDVHFFDDHVDIVSPKRRKGSPPILTFVTLGFNVHEVSCGSRDSESKGRFGLCGATPDEVVRASGAFMCPPHRQADHRQRTALPLGDSTASAKRPTPLVDDGWSAAGSDVPRVDIIRVAASTTEAAIF